MYRIGELSHIAQVSKRTIDYYTNLGLLRPFRSDSNYRYYDEKAYNDLHFIEQCKKLHMPLSEIKELLEQKHNPIHGDSSHVTQMEEVSLHIHHLEKELTQLNVLLDELTEDERNVMMKQVSGKALMLIESLALLVR